MHILYIPAAVGIAISTKISLLFNAQLFYGVLEYTFYKHENPLPQKSDLGPTSLLNAVHFKKFRTNYETKNSEKNIFYI